MTAVVVRRAVAGDEARLAELMGHVHELHVAERPGVFKPLEREVAERWCAETLAKASVQVWLAERDGVALGYALAFVREAPETIFCFARRWYEVDQLSVAPGAREQGVARQLVARVMEAARDEGVSEVELATWAFNQRARTAFQKLGFTPKVIRSSISQRPGPV